MKEGGQDRPRLPPVKFTGRVVEGPDDRERPLGCGGGLERGEAGAEPVALG